MDCRNCQNTKCFINQSCVDSWLEYIQVVKKTTYLPEGGTVFSEGDCATGIFIICSGKVMLSMMLDQQNREIVRLAGPGQILGHRGFTDQMVYPVSAETLEKSEVAQISNEDLMKLLRKSPDLALALILFYSSELMKADKKLKLRTVGSDLQKVKFALQNAFEAFAVEEGQNQYFELGMDIEKFANFANVLPEDLIEILDDLKQNNILSLEGDRIQIMDKHYLINEGAVY
ncbi:MAG: hypothetical protein CVU00_11135 [Bacteroidetes bacterium HGW-Bacteroidetes-17]|jgi:CRP-like cAMP-binding protein|nr:MAG: hypothetical protein CVU00_11135 [Bacteroidetes bacterium HGW-Bacteroidetes-17]